VLQLRHFVAQATVPVNWNHQRQPGHPSGLQHRPAPQAWQRVAGKYGHGCAVLLV